MKNLVIILFLFAILIFCNQMTVNKEHQKISIQVVPEHYEKGWYYVEWEDTLGLANGFIEDKKLYRPQELHCYVTDTNSDTVGNYDGCSTPWTFANFITQDSLVILHFSKGLAMFPEDIKDSASAVKYLKVHQLPIHYKAIEINLKQDLLKHIELLLEEK